MKLISNSFLASQIILIICLILLQTSKSEKIELLHYEGVLDFQNISEFKINFKEMEGLTSNFFMEHSFLSVLANVTIDNPKCTDHSASCGQPVRIYGKINDSPRIGDLYYDQVDENGKFENNGRTVLYGFEYSPCHIKVNDTLYIKLHGVEGRHNFSLSVTYNYLNNYKVLCAGGEEPKLSTYSAAVSTQIGTIKYGGKVSEGNFDSDLYLLRGDGDKKGLTWVKIPLDSTNQPAPRYGHLMLNFENLVILFGGKNEKEENLNDLWILNLDDVKSYLESIDSLGSISTTRGLLSNEQTQSQASLKWINIDYVTTKNIPSKKFLPTGEIIQNHGQILIYGGKGTPEDNNIYLLDLKILQQLFNYKTFYSGKEKTTQYPLEKDFAYQTKANHLWRIVQVKELTQTYGNTITHLGGNEVMFFGGYDKENTILSKVEILNLKDFSVKVPEVSQETPTSRAFHQVMRYGSVLILYGGKNGGGENLNDMWKFVVSSKKWVRVKEMNNNTKERDFYLYKSGFIFTKLENGDRPVIYGGENKNKKMTNVVILLDFEICTSDVKILTDYACIPCSEGYVLSDQKKCIGCYPGGYLKVDRSYYTDSKCEKCPVGSYNNQFFQKDISSCKPCGFGEYNSEIGQRTCQACPYNELCLPGSTAPLKDEFLLQNVEETYQVDFNYPDYMDTHTLKTLTRETALIVVGVILGSVLLVLLICYKVKKHATTKWIISMDFIVLTGGLTKKCSGGLITIIYTILIFSLAASFVMRYLYFNEVIEVIPIANSNTQQDSIKSSFILNVELVGSDFGCVNKDEPIITSTQEENTDLLYRCHKDIEITKLNELDYFISNIKTLSCSLTPSGNCKVTYKCEDCNSITSKDIIQIYVKNNNSFIQLFKWDFHNFWDETFNPNKGESKIEGIFKANDNIKSNYVFKGENPSTIQILFTPIFYTNKNENLRLSGYRTSMNQYIRGDVKNELNFHQSESGVKLNIQFLVNNSSNQIDARDQLEILDFYAFILGMLAGFSFLSRITKYCCERCGLFDHSLENYVELEEEKQPDEKKEKLDGAKAGGKVDEKSGIEIPEIKSGVEDNQANSGYPLNPPN